MGKQHLSRDDRIFMRGKLQGTRENMDMVAMVLMDKCGWHVQEETSDSRDTHSIGVPGETGGGDKRGPHRAEAH